MNLFEKYKYGLINNKVLIKSDVILIGLSGGIDSVSCAILTSKLLLEYNIKIYFAYISHRYSLDKKDIENCDRELKWVINFSNKLNIKLFYTIHSFDNKSNTQHICRKFRYNYFKEVLMKINGSKLFLGHHGDDQVETILLNIFRSSNIVYMKYITNWGYFKIIRPLINFKKSELKEFLIQNSYKHFEDLSNYNFNYKRNVLRLKLINNIKVVFPDYYKKILKLVDNANTNDTFIKYHLNDLCIKFNLKCQFTGVFIKVSNFLSLNIIVKKKLLNYVLDIAFSKFYLHTYIKLSESILTDIINKLDRYNKFSCNKFIFLYDSNIINIVVSNRLLVINFF